MTRAEQAKLLDAAMRSRDPEAFLKGVRAAFGEAGRDRDALVAAVLKALLRAGEIETAMCLRAEWLSRRGTDLRETDPI